MMRSTLQIVGYGFERVLPKSALFQVPLLLALSGSPFLVDALPAFTPGTLRMVFAIVAIVVSSLAVLCVIVQSLALADAAAFAVMAKRVGQPFEPSSRLKALETSPGWGLLQLVVDVVAVACVLVLSASGITYSLVENLGFNAPFNMKAENWQVALYFLDHAMKGAFFDFCEVFQISLQKTLTHRAAFDNPFAYGIVTYRLLMNFLTLQVILLSVTYIFFASRDERVTIPHELDKAKQAASAASNAYYGLKREVDDKEAMQKARRVLNRRDFGKFVRITREKDEGRYVDRKSYKWWLEVCERVGMDHERGY